MRFVLLTTISIALFSSNSFSQLIWQIQNSGTNRELTGVSFVDQNNGWISGWTGTMLHTTNGGLTWAPQTIPPNNAYYSVFFTDTQNGWACGYAGQMIHTTDGGANWSIQATPVTTSLYKLHFVNPDTGWAVGGDQGTFPSYVHHRVILHTTDGGNNWSIQIYQSDKSLLRSIMFIDDNIGYTTGPKGIFLHTSNGGNTWIEQPIDSFFTFADIFFRDSNTGWVVGENLGLPHYAAIFNTTDGGNNWTEISLGLDEALSSIDFPDDLNGWAVGNDYGNGNIAVIYKTTNGGNSWSYSDIPLINSLADVFFLNNSKGWAIGHLGTIVAAYDQIPVELTAFSAVVNGNTVTLNWQTASETNNNRFQVERSGYSGTEHPGEWEKAGFVKGYGTSAEKHDYFFVDKDLNAGSYKYRLKQIDNDGTFSYSDEVNAEISIPDKIVLMQNYPNPFNPSTVINYQLPVRSHVSIKVYDIIGNEVALLVDELKNAGNYAVRFDASSLPNGVYLYQLTALPGGRQAGSFTETKKMILMK